MLRALVIEDDPTFARTLERVLAGQGYAVDRADALAQARSFMTANDYDLALVDQHLPDGSGLTVLSELVEQPQGPVVIMVTGVDRLSSTVEAIQRGAYDYFVKPPDFQELLAVIGRAQHEREIRRQMAGSDPAESAQHKTRIDEILVGRSAPMLRLFKQIARVAPTRTSVLVTGETGTGKELVARAIHEASDRRTEPFVAINCAALNPTLVESELFGHVRGAFTGAARDRPGRFELAGRGTLMLDEIGELELDLQGKLLRAVEERSFERVGEAQARPFEARLLCATHRDLELEIKEGRFREDLYFRLGVVELKIPPLRERKDDIGPIAQHLLRQIAGRLDKPGLVFEPVALQRLADHPWPGNVRELRNVVERSAISAQSVITLDHLARAGVTGDTDAESDGSPEPVSLADMERQHIQATLDRLGWIKKAAVEALGISRPTLDRKIQIYGLKPRRTSSS